MKKSAAVFHAVPTSRAAPANGPAAASALMAWMLSGCMSMSGLSGSSSYACKAPDGVTCDSVSGTYANAVQNNLPSQRRTAGASPGAPQAPRPTAGINGAAAAGAAGAAASRIAVSPSPPPSPTAIPLRSSARILRLWFKPWEDADRDLHDQGYVYVRVDDGQWLVEHAQRQIRDAYAPLRPPPLTPSRPAGGATGSLDPRTSNQSGRTDQPSGSLSLPGLTPPAGRPQMPVDPRGNEPND
jgi:conjugal transfer pilus assembly protein TraV